MSDKRSSDAGGGAEPKRRRGAPLHPTDMDGARGRGAGGAGGGEDGGDDDEVSRVIVQFRSVDGEETGPQLEIPYDISTEQLAELVNRLLGADEPTPYSFFVDDEEVVGRLQEALEARNTSTETVVPVVYQPQAVFRVRSVTRCTSSLPGHAEAVLHVSFSPDGRMLASGSGDATVRLWDVSTEMPRATLRGHTGWVLAVAWAPTSRMLASGSMDGTVRLWDPAAGAAAGRPLVGHKKPVTCLSWAPLHDASGGGTRLASGSKDGAVRIWDSVRRVCVATLGGHTAPVTAVLWGGRGLLYSASQDRTVHVWEAATGKLVRVLKEHAHWVNSLSVSGGAALRRGPFDHRGVAPEGEAEARERARELHEEALSATGGRELLATGSDDFTLFLWQPETSKKPVARMVGHQQQVNFVAFSPDSRYIASASFDKSVRIWSGTTGKFISALRGHVQSVYQVAWSADSRLLVSSSRDSTLCCWDMRSKKVKEHLPGHADEVYAVDWSPDGQRVASGGKDKLLRIWRN